MAAPISSIALASEYVLTPGRVGGVPLGFIMTQSSYERPVTRSVSALLAGSSRQRLNGFIAVP
jgi:hypothetical protein